MTVWLQAEVRLARDAQVAALTEWLGGEGQGAMNRLGGRVWGCWHGAPGIGLRSDSALLFTCWPDDAAAGAAMEWLRNAPPVRGIEGTPLHATARPTQALPVDGAGVWVFREFEINQTDAERFVELSASAWKTFEARFDARIDGLFRAPGPAEGLASLILVTRYANLATWEASRSAEADPESWAHFNERRALTRWTRARSASRVAC